MIINSHKQTGSAHVAIVAILVILLIGALGFIFWQNYITKNEQQPSTVQVATGNSKKDEGVLVQDERYSVLEDWGVRFKLDKRLEATEVVQYKQNEQVEDGKAYYLLNTERGKVAAQKACPSSSSPTGLGLYRFTDKSSINSEGELLNDTAVNGYYYVLVTFGWTCQSGDRSNQVDVQSDNEALRASLQTVEPTE